MSRGNSRRQRVRERSRQAVARQLHFWPNADRYRVLLSPCGTLISSSYQLEHARYEAQGTVVRLTRPGHPVVVYVLDVYTNHVVGRYRSSSCLNRDIITKVNWQKEGF